MKITSPYVLASMTLIAVMYLSGMAAAAVTEKFTLPLVKATSVNTYFDDNSSQWAKSDVTGTNCSIDIKTVTDQNGDAKIDKDDYKIAWDAACPWKQGTVYDNHKGIDFHADYGYEVVSAADGEVVDMIEPKKQLEDDTYVAGSKGNFIIIKHPDESRSVYMHLQASGLNEVGLKVGDKVKRGQKIATVDNNGDSKGKHLHFEVRDNGKTAVDPFKENLWATDGTKNVISPTHILTAEQYAKQAPVAAVAATTPNLGAKIIQFAADVVARGAAAVTSLWQGIAGFFQGLFAPSVVPATNSASPAAGNQAGIGVITKLKASAPAKKTFAPFVPSTGAVTTKVVR